MARFSVRALIGLVAVFAFGLAAMRNGEGMARAIVVGTVLFVLLLTTVGAVVRPSPAATWRGFAIFGWFYLSFLQPGGDDPFCLHATIQRASRIMHPAPSKPGQLTNPILVMITFAPDGRPSIPQGWPYGEPTTTELVEARRYHDASAAYSAAYPDWGRRIENANRIGHASLALAFSLLGAVVGRAMAPPDRIQGTSIPTSSGTAL